MLQQDRDTPNQPLLTVSQIGARCWLTYGRLSMLLLLPLLHGVVDSDEIERSVRGIEIQLVDDNKY